MKVLILNGSPRQNGDTRYVINKVKERFPFDTEYLEIDAFKENIKPCSDCRYCWKNKGCSVRDKMDYVVKDDYDVIVIASPLYMSYLTPPLFSIVTRLNYIWSNKYFLNIPNNLKRKKGILILVGGGDGAPDNAISVSKTAFKLLNVDFDLDKNYIYSLNTNNISIEEDKDVLNQIERVVDYIIN